jgi:uncharacterized RDD family membrane protein YckC
LIAMLTESHPFAVAAIRTSASILVVLTLILVLFPAMLAAVALVPMPH